MTMNRPKEHDYNQLINEIGEKNLQEKYTEILASANKFIEEAGYLKYVECNERILLSLLLDYYADLSRFRDFHGVEWVRTEKSFAYMIYWIVKRKPLQFQCYSEDEKDIFVNERFAVYLLLNECLLCGEKKFVGKECQQKLDDYINLLLYYFKYRECNPQALEMAITSFKMGTMVS